MKAPACAGYHDPQIAGIVRGDNATLCFHLGCCYYQDTDRAIEHCTYKCILDDISDVMRLPQSSMTTSTRPEGVSNFTVVLTYAYFPNGLHWRDIKVYKFRMQLQPVGPPRSILNRSQETNQSLPYLTHEVPCRSRWRALTHWQSIASTFLQCSRLAM